MKLTKPQIEAIKFFETVGVLSSENPFPINRHTVNALLRKKFICKERNLFFGAHDLLLTEIGVNKLIDINGKK